MKSSIHSSYNQKHNAVKKDVFYTQCDIRRIHKKGKKTNKIRWYKQNPKQNKKIET